MNISTLGRYIAFEGIDGTGKTTQINLLADWLSMNHCTVYIVKEPSYEKIGKVARSFMHDHLTIDQRSLALLFASDTLHQQTMQRGVLEKLRQGDWVLSDRSYLSTYAYQMPDCDIEWLYEIHKFCHPPDVTFFMNITPPVAVKRIQESRSHLDLFETLDVLSRVYEQYEIAISFLRKHRQNIEYVDIDPTMSVSSIQRYLQSRVDSLFF